MGGGVCKNDKSQRGERQSDKGKGDPQREENNSGGFWVEKRKMALDKDKLTEDRSRGRKCRAQGVKGSGFNNFYNELLLFST